MQILSAKQNHIVLFGILIGFALSFSNCFKQNERSKEFLQKEVSALNSLDEKRSYLENVLHSIQEIEYEREVMELGELPDDKEIIAYQEKRAKLQMENMIIIEAYFENFGYPSRPELGQYVALAPFAVVYYSDNTEDIKEEHFRYFYGAYKFNDIPESFFLDYLSSYYRMKTGKQYPVQPKESIDYNIHQIFDALSIDY